MNDSIRYAKSVGYLESEASDSSVVLLQNGAYYSLEDTGATVWRTLGGGPRSLNELAEAVQKEYEIDAATVRKDIAQLLGELMEAGLVRDDA